VKKRNIPVIVVTDDRMVRGLVTAVSWMGAQVDAYSWKEIEKAVQRLSVSTITATICLDEANRFRSANVAP
jgi:hypothetical protein